MGPIDTENKWLYGLFGGTAASTFPVALPQAFLSKHLGSCQLKYTSLFSSSGVKTHRFTWGNNYLNCGVEHKVALLWES